jgi:hypothetical protein
MTLKTPEVAVCCSSASFNSSNDRTLSIAITAWSAKVVTSRHRRSAWGEFAGHSVTATLKLLQERGETFRDRLFYGILLGPEPLRDSQQPRPSGEDVTTFGLARHTPPALAPTGSRGSRCALTCARHLSTTCPLLLKASMKI